MTLLEIWLSITLLLLAVAGGFLLWYLNKLLKKFLYISQNLGDLVEVVENYYNHLKHVNNMETYNGDETIKYLLGHTQSLLELMEEYRDVYDISVPLQEEQENLNNDNEDTNPQAQDKKEEEAFSVSEENVFYAGTRRRDS